MTDEPSLDDLKQELEQLKKNASELQERASLETQIRELREANTPKARAKAWLRKVGRGIREHLHEKGARFRENGSQLSAAGSFTGFTANARKAVEQSSFGPPASALTTPIESPLATRRDEPPEPQARERSARRAARNASDDKM